MQNSLKKQHFYSLSMQYVRGRYLERGAVGGLNVARGV